MMAASDLESARTLGTDLHLDTDLDRFQSYSAGSACPSLASSFVSYGSSPTDVHAHRRASGSQSDSSVGLSHSTSRTSLSPMTPYSAGVLDIVMPAPTVGCGQPQLLVPGAFHCNEPASEDLNFQWMSHEPKEPPVDESTLFSATHPYMRSSHESYLSTDQGLAAGAALDLSLSRSIFHHRQLSDDQINQLDHWRPSMLHSSPRTVVPSATFQPILPSSPSYHMMPSTPIQSQFDLMSRLDSSPFTSPAYAPSDSSLFLPSDDRIIQPTLVRTMRETRRPIRGRKATKKDDPSRPSRLSKSTPRTMPEYPGIIERNCFACKAEGCVDKYGNPKRFKRQEHLKRHQRTCHTGSRPHYCWVPDCKTAPFSRTDNLNSHLLKTHGKNSPAARNRYIATLDPKSGVFDISYRGPFKKDGWPGVDDED